MMDDIRYAGCGLRVFLGVFTGLGLAVLYSLIASVALVFGSGRAQLAEAGASSVTLILLYFGIGLAGGITVGLLLPLTRKRWGAVVLGIIVCTMIYTAMFMVFEPNLIQEGLFAPLVRGLFGGVPTGIAAGLYLWEPPVDPRLSRSSGERIEGER